MHRMPLTFIQAKAKLGVEVVLPGSPEHLEIITLMRQSGHVFPEDNIPQKPQPIRTFSDLKPYRERPATVMKPLSKAEFMSTKTTRKAIKEHIEANADCVKEDIDEITWKGKTLEPGTCIFKGMSKRKFISLLK